MGGSALFLICTLIRCFSETVYNSKSTEIQLGFLIERDLNPHMKKSFMRLKHACLPFTTRSDRIIIRKLLKMQGSKKWKWFCFGSEKMCCLWYNRADKRLRSSHKEESSKHWQVSIMKHDGVVYRRAQGNFRKRTNTLRWDFCRIFSRGKFRRLYP